MKTFSAWLVSTSLVLASATALGQSAPVATPKISLTAAIATAEKLTGGRAIEADLEDDYGVRSYEVTIVTGAGVEKIVLDPQTGNLLERRAKRAKPEKLARANAIGQAATSLTEAIAAAEKEGGAAVEAELETKHGAAAYEIKLVQGAWTRKVLVDPATGQLRPKA